MATPPPPAAAPAAPAAGDESWYDSVAAVEDETVDSAAGDGEGGGSPGGNSDSAAVGGGGEIAPSGEEVEELDGGKGDSFDAGVVGEEEIEGYGDAVEEGSGEGEKELETPDRVEGAREERKEGVVDDGNLESDGLNSVITAREVDVSEESAEGEVAEGVQVKGDVGGESKVLGEIAVENNKAEEEHCQLDDVGGNGEEEKTLSKAVLKDREAQEDCDVVQSKSVNDESLNQTVQGEVSPDMSEDPRNDNEGGSEEVLEVHENGKVDDEKSAVMPSTVVSAEKAEEIGNDDDGKEAILEELGKEVSVPAPVEGEKLDAFDDDGDNEELMEEEVDNVGSDEMVEIVESPEAVKALMKELEEASSSMSTHSGSANSREYSHSMDGQIVVDEEDDDDEYDEDGDDKEVFDSAALAALLKAATGSSQDGNITVTSQDGTRVFSIDRPAGLGSSVPSLRPAAARSSKPNVFAPMELAVTPEASEEMTEEEKKMHEKVESIRVKFLRLVYRLGHSPEETVAAQVLYRLSLAEGIRRGRQTSRSISLESARKKALQLEAEGKDDLNFSCNILVLGKTGVGKSATINSIFGEEKSQTDAFHLATPHVREISGAIDGVLIRIIDTPGLRPSVMDQSANRKILAAVKKVTKKCPPDIVLYVDRIDSRARDLNDLPLLKTITSCLGSSIWFNAIVALTHAASAPPDSPTGSPMTYENFVNQRSHFIQQLVRQAAGDLRLMNPVALVENHPSCRKNREGQKVLPNGLSWRQQLLLLCYSSKILSEANNLLKLQDSSPPGKLFGFRLRSPPLPFLLSSLLQSRAHPKLASNQGGDNGDSDAELDDFSDAEQEDEEDEYDQLPPFKPLKKAQLAKLGNEQRKAYFEEYDYRVKLLQKKQLKEEVRRLREMKKKGKVEPEPYAFGDMADDYEQDGAPAAVPVPMPDMVLPPTFDGDTPTYRYRFLEPTSNLLARPVLDSHGWDHDCGYDGVNVEESLAVANRFPIAVSVQVTKDKKDFNIHLESAASAKHGENGSSLAGFDIQTVGRQLAYIIRGETKFKNLKRNRTTGGFSVTFLGETVATGVKMEDQLVLGKRLVLVASTGAVRAQGDTAYGANLEARVRDKDYPIGQSLTTLGLSLMRWHGDLAVGANMQSQIPIGRSSKMAVRLGLNNKLSGQISVKTSTAEHLQIALMAILPVASSIYKMLRPGESFEY